MTIRHLKIFIAVADTGKMSTAAAKYYISQPTVSQTIKELEDHYKTLLFERISKKLYITDPGKNLLSYARMVVKQFEELEEHMFRGQAEKLRVGATITIGASMLQNFLNEFSKDNPLVETYAYVNNTKAIEDKLLKSELDMGIVEGQVKSIDLVNIPVIKDYLVLVCNKEHPFAGRKRIMVKELEKETFVLREEGSGTRELFESYMSSCGLKINIGWEVTCPEGIKNAVLKNNCLAVISIRLVEEEIKSGQMYVIKSKEKAWDRSFHIVYYKNKYVNENMKALMNIVENNKNEDILQGIVTGNLVKD